MPTAKRKKKAAPKSTTSRKTKPPIADAEEVDADVAALAAMCGGWGEQGAERRFKVIPEGNHAATCLPPPVDVDKGALAWPFQVYWTTDDDVNKEQKSIKFFNWIGRNGEDQTNEALGEFKADLEMLDIECPDDLDPTEAAEWALKTLRDLAEAETTVEISIRHSTGTDTKTGKKRIYANMDIEGFAAQE